VAVPVLMTALGAVRLRGAAGSGAGSSWLLPVGRARSR